MNNNDHIEAKLHYLFFYFLQKVILENMICLVFKWHYDNYCSKEA